MKPKQIDQLSFDSGTLSISGWSQSGPPQSVRYDGRVIYQNKTIGVDRPDVVACCGPRSASWGFSTLFHMNLSDFDAGRLSVTFPDGEAVGGQSVHRIFVRVEVERVVRLDAQPSTARTTRAAASEHLRDLSNSVWGEQRVHSGPPRVESHFDAHLVPVIGFPDQDPHWGVYQSDGSLIDAAAHKRGPGRVLLGQSETMRARQDFSYVDEVGVYGGLTVPHFGHYLLSSLSRHWKNWKETFPGTKIYMHTMESLEGWLARPHVRQTMAALGYEDDDFVPIAGPIRMRHLIVPAAGFVEQCEAYRAFGEIGQRIGERLWQGGPPVSRSEPVYLSKERLRSGVWTLANETELVGALRGAGVRIVYPETLSLPEQIRIFAEHRTVLGLAGSALHTSLLSQGGHRLIGINPTEYLNSNFVLLDKLKDNSSTYVIPATGMVPADGGTDFIHAFALPDPQRMARELLRLAG